MIRDNYSMKRRHAKRKARRCQDCGGKLSKKSVAYCPFHLAKRRQAKRERDAAGGKELL